MLFRSHSPDTIASKPNPIRAVRQFAARALPSARSAAAGFPTTARLRQRSWLRGASCGVTGRTSVARTRSTLAAHALNPSTNPHQPTLAGLTGNDDLPGISTLLPSRLRIESQSTLDRVGLARMAGVAVLDEQRADLRLKELDVLDVKRFGGADGCGAECQGDSRCRNEQSSGS